MLSGNDDDDGEGRIQMLLYFLFSLTYFSEQFNDQKIWYHKIKSKKSSFSMLQHSKKNKENRFLFNGINCYREKLCFNFLL